ncbi:hypothetical protein HYC85_029108 [Camellia sinensis]|uniref:Uncharacterized protein n=1 Tax=Camellia sinensis TaxID=4442 RepID=A0A7J7FXR2_CAMSI|nr:hypothetical protein HYC85_029108 [Camellia sinensis]
MSTSPPAAPYAGNFVPQEPPLLGRIVIELSQPEVASSYSRDMPALTQTLDQVEARGKDKAKVDADPIEQLLWAVEALKVRGMNKQQTSAIVIKVVDDAFPTPIKGSSSQVENRDGPRHAQTIPVVPNPAPGKGQKAKAAPADPFASASGKNPQTSKYLPRGRRVFHDLHMPLSGALLILAKNGHLKPLEPRPLPKNLPATHDATLYCAYHQQSGHSTDGCSRLRHEVQDLIDNKVILPPASAKSVTTQLLDFEGSDTASMVCLVVSSQSPLYIIPGNFIVKSSPQRFHSVSVHAMVSISSQKSSRQCFQGDCVHIFVVTIFVIAVSKSSTTANEDCLRIAAAPPKQGATFRCHEPPFKLGNAVPFSTFERVSTPTGSIFEVRPVRLGCLFENCRVQNEPNAVLWAECRLIPNRVRAVCPESGSGLLGFGNKVCLRQYKGPGASSVSSSEPELEPSPVSSSDDSDSASASASDSSSSSSSSGTGARELLPT